MKNKIGIIGIRGLPARYGAFDTFVDQFVKSERVKAKDNFFFISCDKSFKNQIYENENVERIFVFRGKGIVILIHYFISILIMLFKGVRKFIFFGYGAALFFPLIKLFNGKVICNPDGIEWRRPESKLKKYFFKICEILISKQNIIKIYDSNVIKRYYKIIHGSDGIVAYYPSGYEEKKKIFKRKKSYERFYILGRLLEENNTEMIVKAFTKLNIKKKLYIIGNKSEYFEKKIIPLIKKSKNIFFIGAIYDRNKLYKICSLCDCYIHGHSVGGTNPTLIEAVNLEKKIISYKTFFNKEILENNATYFKTEIELFNILNKDLYKNELMVEFKPYFHANHINQIYIDLVK